MYVLLKTHKFDATTITEETDLKQLCKVRHIVSCCGSPTENLAWLCTKILSPLRQFVPSHLNNIHGHLDTLSRLSEEDLRGLSFCTADVCSLYTNIDIQACVDDVMDLAAEHADELPMFGLQLVDVHEILELVLSSSYFVFDNS